MHGEHIASIIAADGGDEEVEEDDEQAEDGAAVVEVEANTEMSLLIQYV